MLNIIKKNSIVFLLAFWVLFLVAFNGVSHAGKFPEREVKIIVSVSPGGGTDTMVRTAALYLEKELGVPIIIINRPGGGQIVGTTMCVSSKPDGYTLCNFSFPITIMGSYEKGVKYKAPDDFHLIGSISDDIYSIAVRADSPYQDLKTFLKAAKEKPGKINVATTGPVGISAISIYQVQDKTNTDLKIITYESGSDGTAALLGGHIDSQAIPAARATALHKAGKIKILTVFAEKRMKRLPDVPTFKEITGKKILASSVRGLACSVKVPAERAEILKAAWRRILNNKEFIGRISKLQPITPRTGEEFKKFINEQRPVIKRARELIESFK